MSHSHNHADFRTLARRRVSGPIFDDIDGGSDDEGSKRRNAAAFSVTCCPRCSKA